MNNPLTAQQIVKFDTLINSSEDENELVVKLAGELAETSEADFAMLAASVDDEPDMLELQALVRSSSSRAVGRRAALAMQVPHEMLEDCLDNILKTSPGTPFPFVQTVDSGTRLFHILGVNLAVAKDAPAALLLAREGQPFDEDTFTLLRIVSTRLESALRHFRTSRQLAREALGLRTVLKIDRIRDTSSTLDEMLTLSLTEVCRVIPSEAGFVMLYDKKGNPIKMHAITNQGLLAYDDVMQEVQKMADQAIREGKLFNFTSPQPGSHGNISSLMGVPLILQDRVIGVLGIINRSEKNGFSPADQELLQAISSQMDTAIFERLQTQRLREAFGRNVGPQVMDHLLDIDDRDLLRGERVEVTTLFSDIRGFTNFSETLDPSVLENLINDHLGAMTSLILENDGMLDKFTGDGMMALFNVPARMSDYALRAVQTALAMQKVHQEMTSAVPTGQAKLPPIGIGISTGVAVAGNFGSSDHAEYTVIGMSVNRSARLCGVASSDQILVDARTYELVQNEVEAHALEPVVLKGISQPVENWEVLGLKSKK